MKKYSCFLGVRESITSSLYTKHSPETLKFLCVFSAQFSFHEMNSYPPEQINTTPALHVHSQRRASNFSASEVQLSSGVCVCVCLKHLSSFFSFMFTWCFLETKQKLQKTQGQYGRKKKLKKNQRVENKNHKKKSSFRNNHFWSLFTHLLMLISMCEHTQFYKVWILVKLLVTCFSLNNV